MIHNTYARLSPRDTKIVDRAYDAVAKTFAAHDMLRNNMDDAERLVEAIAVFLVGSNPGRQGTTCGRAVHRHAV